MHIKLRDIVKRFDAKQVLNGVSLEIAEGQFVALLGPSGCGKTTLLHAIAGLTELDGGTIEVGQSLWSSQGYNLAPEQRNVGMVFQDFALWPHMTVYDNVAFGLKVKKVPSHQIKARVMEVLNMVQMGDYVRHLPHQLSGGQKQRVAIARALAPRPTLMLMDEPLSSLDAKLREKMRWDLLSVIRKAGITTIFVTHDQEEALSMADHVVVMNQGQIEQQGSPTELYRSPATTFVATFVGASNLLRGEVVEKSGAWITVDCNGCRIQSASHANVGEAVTLMIRPSDIEFARAENSIRGTIVQRAYHGFTWQYRVITDSFTGGHPIEVWDTEERPVGTDVFLCFPPERCQVVAETKHAVTV